MSILAELIADMDAALASGEESRRRRTVIRLAETYERGAALFSDEQVAVFDGVIQRFSRAIETRARVELAERLSTIPNPPVGVLRQLAHDEIEVARPILQRSSDLADGDLIGVAMECGREHMLAICGRASVSVPLSDVLVRHGDGEVHKAIAGNRGARFSESSLGLLVVSAREDKELNGLLGERSDLSESLRQRLVDAAEEIVRIRLSNALPGHEVEVSTAVARGSAVLAAPRRGPRSYEPALAEMRTLLAVRQVTETDVHAFATARKFEHVVLAIVSVSGLSIAALEMILDDPHNELLQMIGKAQGWSWRTMKTLLQMRDPALVDRVQLKAVEAAFEELILERAQRGIRILKLTSSASASAGRWSGARQPN